MQKEKQTKTNRKWRSFTAPDWWHWREVKLALLWLVAVVYHMTCIDVDPARAGRQRIINMADSLLGNVRGVSHWRTGAAARWRHSGDQQLRNISARFALRSRRRLSLLRHCRPQGRQQVPVHCSLWKFIIRLCLADGALCVDGRAIKNVNWMQNIS